MKRFDGSPKMRNSMRPRRRNAERLIEPPRISTPARMPNAWRIKELAELALAFRYQS